MHKVLTHTDLALSELFWYLQPEKKIQGGLGIEAF